MTRCAIAAGAGQHGCGEGSRAMRVMPEPMAALHRQLHFSDLLLNVTEVQP